MSFHSACQYLGIGETVFNEKIAAGKLPPKIKFGDTRRVVFDLVALENARLEMMGEPAMSADQAILFRATAAAALIALTNKPTSPMPSAAHKLVNQPFKAVNSIFALGMHGQQHQCKK